LRKIRSVPLKQAEKAVRRAAVTSGTTRVAPLKQAGREDASAGEGLPAINPPEGGRD